MAKGKGNTDSRIIWTKPSCSFTNLIRLGLAECRGSSTWVLWYAINVHEDDYWVTPIKNECASYIYEEPALQQGLYSTSNKLCTSSVFEKKSRYGY